MKLASPVRSLVPGFAAALAALLMTSGVAQGADPPQFKLGFKALADQIPNIVGLPLEAEHHGPNGDSLQTTSNGLMAWRKADNWTAFTDGSRTWINGPAGVQDRPNEQRYPWEGSGQQAGAPAPPLAVSDADAGPPDNWLERLNYYRRMARLPAVVEKPELSDADSKHARYLVMTGDLGHTESPGPWYTAEGDAAGRSSNVEWGSPRSDGRAIDWWMATPFHGIGLVDPHLKAVGYGSYTDAGQRYAWGGALNVLNGLDGSVKVVHPVIWPGDGTTVWLARLSHGEVPDPLAGTGFQEPVGLPLLVLLGPGNHAVSQHDLRANGASVAHILYDGNSYSNPDANSQASGRAVLWARGGVAILPRDPLTPGATYTASITADGKVIQWSFKVAANAE